MKTKEGILSERNLQILMLLSLLLGSLSILGFMITELAGIFPVEPGTVELYANKFSGAFQAVKTKYNSGNSPATITKVCF